MEEPEPEEAAQWAEECINRHREQLDKAIREKKNNTAWKIASQIGEDYMECIQKNTPNLEKKEKGEKGRCNEQVSIKVEKISAKAAEGGCPWTHWIDKMMKLKRQLKEMRTQNNWKRQKKYETEEHKDLNRQKDYIRKINEENLWVKVQKALKNYGLREKEGKIIQNNEVKKILKEVDKVIEWHEKKIKWERIGAWKTKLKALYKTPTRAGKTEEFSKTS